MPRPRKPTQVLELQGAFAKNPQRRREDPKTSGGLGEPPEHFDEYLADMWREMAASAPIGVLTCADRFLVELACHLMIKLRTFGTTRPDGLSGAEQSQLTSILGRLGCSPADRSKVSAKPAGETDDDLSEFLQ